VILQLRQRFRYRADGFRQWGRQYGPERWIQLTSGEYHDDKEQFSPDGNTMYFTSNRDGFTCMWALRLDPKTKRPLGAPFAIQHFHGSQRIYAGISESNHMEVDVARDKIVTNLDEFRSDIWMTQLEGGNRGVEKRRRP